MLVCHWWQHQPWYPLLLELIRDVSRIFLQLRHFHFNARTVAPVSRVGGTTCVFLWVIWRSIGEELIPLTVVHLLLVRNRISTNSEYEAAFIHWSDWCEKTSTKPMSKNVVDFRSYKAVYFQAGM